MRILMLTRYGRKGASSRYRSWQYVPLYERAGHEVEVRALMDDGYLRQLYNNRGRGLRWVAEAYVRRVVDGLRMWKYDAVICEQEMMPYIPAGPTLILRRICKRFYLDYDDAAYAKYMKWPVLRNKIGKLMAAADGVVTGNENLAAYARRYTDRVHVIPTVVDIGRYAVKERSAENGEVRIGWIGTPVTAVFLKRILEPLKRLQAACPQVKVRLIGAGRHFDCGGVKAEIEEWSEETEAERLRECDIGIMPLHDNEFTRGKCGLKLVQYMACGLPVVASPVGVNREIVEEGRNGYLAATAGEWKEKLERLVRNAELRREMGREGRARAEERYTLERGFAQWQAVLEGKPAEAAGEEEEKAEKRRYAAAGAGEGRIVR